MPAEYVEAFYRYFAEGSLDDAKAPGVRALIPDFRRPRARAPGAAAGRGRRRSLAEAINEQLRLVKIHLPYHEPGHVLNLAYTVLTGGTGLEDIKRLRRDVAYMTALGADLVPNPATASGFCRRFTEAGVVALMDAGNSVRAKLWRGRGRDLPGPVASLGVDGPVVPTTGSHKQGGLCGRAPI